MNTITLIILFFTAIIALLLLIALFIKKEHFVQRNIIINAAQPTVFDYIKLLKNQETFNTNAMEDPNRNWEFRGTDGTVGYTIAWNGNKKAGEGEKEIMKIVEGKSIETQIRFIKPMKAIGNAIMDTESLSSSQTKVIWSNSGTLNYPLNLLIPMLEKNVAKDMDKSLINLKTILEK
jgi:hypothetical protein